MERDEIFILFRRPPPTTRHDKWLARALMIKRLRVARLHSGGADKSGRARAERALRDRIFPSARREIDAMPVPVCVLLSLSPTGRSAAKSLARRKGATLSTLAAQISPEMGRRAGSQSGAQVNASRVEKLRRARGASTAPFSPSAASLGPIAF